MGKGFALAALLFVLAGAGAASGSRAALTPAQYKAKLASIGKESDKTQSLISTGLSAKDVSKLVAALGQFAKAEDHVADEVAALKPPAKAVAANAQLAKGLHDIADAVRGVAAKVKGVKTMTEAKAILNKDGSGAKAGAEVDGALTKLSGLGLA